VDTIAQVSASIGRAQACVARRNSAGAVEWLRRALTEDPLSALAHALLAMCLADTQRLYAAEHEATLALELEPELDVAHLAMAEVRLGQRKLAQAESHLDELLRLDPDSQGALRLRARIASADGRLHEAVAVLEQARSLDPEDMATLVALGHAYLAVHRLGEANEVSLDVLRENADSHAGLVLRGWVVLLHGDTADAREHALLVLRHGGDNHESIRLLVATKARSSIFLGLWWRFNARLSTMTGQRQALTLIGMYVGYRLVVIVADQRGYHALALVVACAWIAFVLYTYAAVPVFKRMLARELGSVRLRRGF
jgi:predicted Zn-dependent protease